MRLDWQDMKMQRRIWRVRKRCEKMGNKHTMNDLYQMQSLPLSAKIRMTARRINEWVNEHGGFNIKY